MKNEILLLVIYTENQLIVNYAHSMQLKVIKIIFIVFIVKSVKTCGTPTKSPV